MTPMRNRGHVIRAVATLSIPAVICLTAALLIGAPVLPRIAHASEIPTFAVDASWPKPLPNN